MKTVEQYLENIKSEELCESIRNEVVRHMLHPDKLYPSLRHVFANFNWKHTDKGYSYWLYIDDKVKRGMEV